MSPSLAPGDLLNRVERDVQRALQRSRNGLRYAAGTQRPKVGRTPKDVVWRRHKSELWRYRSDTRRYRPPLVIVHSLVSRSYVLDLYPGNSAVEHLLREGLDVFLLDWGVPDETDAGNTLEYYVDDGIPEAVAAACETAGTDDVNLLGYCFGGVLSLLSAARHPELPIRNLAAMATPVDFSQMETITALVRDGRLDPEDVVEPTGNVPPDVIENGFKMLKPTAEVTQYATSSWRATRRWASGHATTSRSRAPPSSRPSTGSCAPTGWSTARSSWAARRWTSRRSRGPC
jgi:polyhydroxyalkanoate synthase subunit PhaC